LDLAGDRSQVRAPLAKRSFFRPDLGRVMEPTEGEELEMRHPAKQDISRELDRSHSRSRSGDAHTTTRRWRRGRRASGTPASSDALAQERMRIAADIHDLLMQDLALALANARTLAADPARGPEAAAMVAAAERALASARAMVDDLAGRDREPVIEALAASARTAARRVPLTFSAAGVEAEAQPDAETLETLVHVAREAVTNAVKHAHPASIEVVLEHDDEWRLLVTDDGDGFTEGAGDAGFGLRSMRRQARALGGTLRILSTAGAGTTVEVLLP
jgi:signal transduction histidine kinase